MAPASNVTDLWHPLYTGRVPTAENSEGVENSEGAQLTSPAHVELEPAAAPSEEEPPTLTPARNVTDPLHPLYAGHTPAAENSEDTQLQSPAQDQLEAAAAPAERSPELSSLFCVALFPFGSSTDSSIASSCSIRT